MVQSYLARESLLKSQQARKREQQVERHLHLLSTEAHGELFLYLKHWLYLLIAC